MSSFEHISRHWKNKITYAMGKRKMRTIINGDPKWVGIMTNMSGGHEFSKNVNNFYLNTGWDGNNDVKQGKVIYQDWLNGNFKQREAFFNQELTDTDWRLAGFIAAPAKNLDGRRGTYAKEIQNPEFGESDVAVTMYYIYNIKTGEVRRLIADESIWLSLGFWDTRPDCARDALLNAGDCLDSGDDVWGSVRELLLSRIKAER